MPAPDREEALSVTAVYSVDRGREEHPRRRFGMERTRPPTSAQPSEVPRGPRNCSDPIRERPPGSSAHMF